MRGRGRERGGARVGGGLKGGGAGPSVFPPALGETIPTPEKSQWRKLPRPDLDPDQDQDLQRRRYDAMPIRCGCRGELRYGGRWRRGLLHQNRRVIRLVILVVAGLLHWRVLGALMYCKVVGMHMLSITRDLALPAARKGKTGGWRVIYVRMCRWEEMWTGAGSCVLYGHTDADDAHDATGAVGAGENAIQFYDQFF